MQRQAIKSLLLFVFLSHCLLLANHNRYWDGWIDSILMQEQDWSTLKEMWTQLGQPQVYYVYTWISALFDNFIIGYRILTMLSLLTVTTSIYYIAHRVMKLPTAESGFIAAFAAIWPFYNVFASESLMHYVVSFALFYLGWALYFRATAEQRKPQLCAAFTLIAISAATTNSLLITYYGFVLICFIYVVQATLNLKSIAQFAKHYWFLLIFPVIVFIAKSVLLRPYGMYDGYNHLLFHDHSFTESLFYIAVYGNITLFSFLKIVKMFKIVIASAWPVFMVLLVIMYALIRSWNNNEIVNPNRRQIVQLLWLTLAFLLLAVLPYAAAGKFLYGGWGERHGILLAPGFAFLFTAVGLYLRQKNLRAAILLYAFLLSVCCSTLNYAYAMWQARGLLDDAVMENLPGLALPPDDALVLYDAPKDFIIDTYRSYELSGMFYNAWHKLTWYPAQVMNGNLEAASYLATYPDISKTEFEKKVELVNDYTPSDCVALINVTLSDPATTRATALKGYYYRRIFAPSETADYVKHLFKLDISYPGHHCGT